MAAAVDPLAQGEESAAAPTVTVRYWAASRAAAGVPQEQISARTLAEALQLVAERHTSSLRFAEVVAVSSVLVGEQPIGRRDPAGVALHDGDVVDILPPFAGG